MSGKSSDHTHLVTCNNSLEEESVNALGSYAGMPYFFYRSALVATPLVTRITIATSCYTTCYAFQVFIA